MKEQSLQFGIRENWQQFTLLLIVNAFVGGMIGLERSIFPRFADTEFGISSNTAILSFIVAFGITKAITNYFAGKLANKIGRKNLLVIGWLFALPVPLLFINAPSWNWIVFANVLLGINQGLTWSSTVVMKIDLVGEKNRGFAMGLNEFTGYLAVGLIAFLSAYVADKYGVNPYPFYIGIALAILGLLFSFFLIKDTRKFVQYTEATETKKTLSNVFVATTFTDKTLSSVTQAGLVNNLNDGMIWGLLPIVLVQQFDVKTIGLIAAIYPGVWGIGQLFTGKMADSFPKKKMLFLGMLLQGVAILFIPYASTFLEFVAITTTIGLGTALVYPTFLTTIAQQVSANQRAESIGVFRLWRDLGYAFGAILSGVIADIFGINYAILTIGLLTVVSAIILQIRMPK
jgi:MFS family permease